MLMVFNLIGNMKNVGSQKLLLYPKDHTKFLKSYIKYKIYKRVSYIKWRNCVINYMVDNGINMDDSIKYFADYIKNNKK